MRNAQIRQFLGLTRTISDDGHLRVTFHHNLYENVTQRLPRVRFGEVHVYNNYYKFTNQFNYPFLYAWGVGYSSKIYAQNNYFDFAAPVDPAQIIGVYKGTAIHAEGTMMNGPSRHNQVDVVAAYNAAHPDQPLSSDVGWVPTLYSHINPAESVPAIVREHAGAGKLHDSER